MVCPDAGRIAFTITRISGRGCLNELKATCLAAGYGKRKTEVYQKVCLLYPVGNGVTPSCAGKEKLWCPQ